MIFGWGKSDSENTDKPFEPQPEKAKKFFDHARTVGATDQLDYSLKLWASGLKYDPENLAAHQAMYEVAVRFNERSTPASSKEIREIDGTTAVDKMVVAEFTWMRDLNNVSAALRLLDAAGKAGQNGLGQWLAPKLLNMLRATMAKKPQKKVWVQAIDVFSNVGAWNEAFVAGEEALKLDPSDGVLEQRTRNLTAERAIQQGGFQKNFGKEGGFKGNLRDAEGAKQLEAANSTSGAGGSEEIKIAKARSDYEENPMSPDAINRYGSLLRSRGQPEDEARAIEVFLAGFKRINEYRFKINADDLRIAQVKRIERHAREKLEQAPDNPQLLSAHELARAKLLEIEGEVYRERITKYPTNREMRSDLGRIEYELGNYQEAMAAFQSAKDDPKLKVNSAWLLGKCFSKEGWHSEAVGEFKEALSAIDVTQAEKELDIKYDLMLALIELAKLEKSAVHAKEAADLCSAMIRKNIGYKDVRIRRKEVDELIRTLG